MEGGCIFQGVGCRMTHFLGVSVRGDAPSSTATVHDQFRFSLRLLLVDYTSRVGGTRNVALTASGPRRARVDAAHSRFR